MRINKEEAKEFTEMYFQKLSERFGVESRVTLKVDIKNIDERITDVKEKTLVYTSMLLNEYRNLSEAFGIAVPPIEIIEKRAASEALTIIPSGSYDSEIHTVHATTYPDVDSLIRFKTQLGVRMKSTPENVVKHYTNILPSMLAGEVGHACRAAAIDYAGRKSHPDLFVIAGNKEGNGFFENNKLEDENYRKAFRNNGFRYFGCLKLGEFFDSIGALESESIMKGTKYEFKPVNTLDRLLKNLEKSKEEAKRMAQTHEIDFKSISLISNVKQHLPNLICYQQYEKNPNEFREKYIYNEQDPLIKWPPRRVLETFLLDTLKYFV